MRRGLHEGSGLSVQVDLMRCYGDAFDDVAVMFCGERRDEEVDIDVQLTVGAS